MNVYMSFRFEKAGIQLNSYSKNTVGKLCTIELELDSIPLPKLPHLGSGQVETTYTDFSKAIDQIDHSVLLGKLDVVGVSSPLLNRYASYLLNRVYYVCYGEVCSDAFVPTSGVPNLT